MGVKAQGWINLSSKVTTRLTDLYTNWKFVKRAILSPNKAFLGLEDVGWLIDPNYESDIFMVP